MNDLQQHHQRVFDIASACPQESLRGICIQSGSLIVAFSGRGESAMLTAPSLADGTVDQLLDLLQRLPEGFGLLLHRGATHPKVLHLEQDVSAHALKHLIRQRRPGASVPDHAGGEQQSSKRQHCCRFVPDHAGGEQLQADGGECPRGGDDLGASG